MEQNNAIRLQVRLARAGLASRRKCEEFIADGRVMVNGEIVRTPGTKVTTDDEVTFDGRPVREEKKKVYIALHKPAGFLCSDEDPDGRPLAKSLLDVVVKERIYHVGRLDYMTSGLIFFTNDGEFARALTHPSKKVEKEYIVSTKSEIPAELMERFLRGVTVEGIRYRASEAELLGPRKARIVLTEGKNRELRKVFLSMSASIKKVHRVRIGPVNLKGIEAGRFRHLREGEVKALMEGKGGRTPRGAAHQKAKRNQVRSHGRRN
ncbi:MAG: pseudouridine synthase [Spirochaetaceae bacterium]|nr:pseudouridine synthase [Spirochaetaceae bacterium]MDT8299599.1 pseudouridine synthase [Spirochaetaceae bacterium]